MRDHLSESSSGEETLIASADLELALLSRSAYRNVTLEEHSPSENDGGHHVDDASFTVFFLSPL